MQMQAANRTVRLLLPIGLQLATTWTVFVVSRSKRSLFSTGTEHKSATKLFQHLLKTSRACFQKLEAGTQTLQAQAAL